jgi:hypothetical protein
VSRSDLVDKIHNTGCCDRLFGQVVVIGCLDRLLVDAGYLYRFGAWLMHLFMVQVEVQVGAWLMHLFMVQIDCRLLGTGCCMVDAWFRLLVHVVWCRLIGIGLEQYISQ